MAWPEKGQALRWLVVVLSLFGNFAEGLRIHVGPRAEECIEERVRDPSDTITAAFVAMAAGDKDGLDRQQKYDLKVHNPEGKVIYKPTKRNEHKFTVPADGVGNYRLCFYNNERYEGSLMYHSHIGHKVPEHEKAKRKDIDPLRERLINLNEDIANMKAEQHFMLDQDRAHRSINVRTNRLVLTRAVVESAGIILAGVSQVVFMRRFFSRRETPFRINV